MAQSQAAVVVGGGIWGLSTAYHLARAGACSVTLLERNAELAAETTPRAAGLVGQIRSNPVMLNAIQYALSLFANFPTETGHDPGLRRTGSLLVALSDERMAAYEKQVAAARASGVDANFVSHAEMQRLAPGLNVAQLKGGYFVSGDGYLDPRRCALAYAAAASDLGVTIRTNCRVTGIRIRGDAAVGVETSDGPVEADRVIVTAGPWTGLLAQQAGFQMPMQPIRHQRAVTVPATGIPPHHPVVRITDVSCYVRPEGDAYLYGFFEPDPTSIDLAAKPAGFRTDDLEPPRATMNEARRRLAPIFPVLGELDIEEFHYGMTTFAPDGRYLIGPVPGVEGLFVASGCAALGIAGSAAIGRWLADCVQAGRCSDELDLFALGRFGEMGRDPARVRKESEQFYAGYYAIPPG